MGKFNLWRVVDGGANGLGIESSKGRITDIKGAPIIPEEEDRFHAELIVATVNAYMQAAHGCPNLMQKENICPECGSDDLYFGEGIERDDVYYVEAECRICGFSGNATYVKVFNGFTDINGNPVIKKEISEKSGL